MTLAETKTFAENTTNLAVPRKFRAAEKRAAEAGFEFALFALIDREDTPGQWDLVVSANWTRSDRAGIAKIIEVVSEGSLTTVDWFLISRIVPLDTADEFVGLMTHLYPDPIRHQMVEVPASTLGTTRINRAVIITADPRLIPESPNIS